MSTSHRLVSQLINAIPDPVVIVASDGTIIAANSTAEKNLSLGSDTTLRSLVRMGTGLRAFLQTCQATSLSVPHRLKLADGGECVAYGTRLSVPGTPFDGCIIVRLDQRIDIASKFSALDAELKALGEKYKRTSAEKDQLEDHAHKDALTGVLNRRGFDTAFGMEHKRAGRYERPLSVAILDLDHFKSINDSHGHAIGDAMIRHFAGLCQQTVRDQDIIARIGGEEFAVLLPETNLIDASVVVARIVEAAAVTPLKAGNNLILCTASAGISMLRRKETTELLLQRADDNLYRAKHGGRNRYVADPGLAA